MCKTYMKTNLYYANICKHEHEKILTRLWCKIMLKIVVEQTKGNEGSYFYLYSFGDLAQRSFQGSFYVCIE
jgi:hypothetical protein